MLVSSGSGGYTFAALALPGGESGDVVRPATFIDDSPDLVDAKKGKKDHHNKGHGNGSNNGNGHRHGRKGDWQTVEGEGYGGEYSYVAADGKGEPSATWTLEGLEPGKTYQVLVTWVADPANATSTTWTIADGSGGGVLLSISDVDQTELRPDATLGGHAWQLLVVVTAESGGIVVRLDAAGSSGRVVADAVALVEVGETIEPGQVASDGDVVLAAAATNDPPAKTWFGWLVDLLGSRFGKAESERFRARDQTLADLQVEPHPYANLPLRPQDIQAYDDATGIPVAGPIIQFTYGDMVRPGESRKAAANAGVQVAVGAAGKVASQLHHIATHYGAYGKKFKALFAQAGIKGKHALDYEKNLIELVGHCGRHTEASHERVYDYLSKKMGTKTGDEAKKALDEGLAYWRRKLRKNPRLPYEK